MHYQGAPESIGQTLSERLYEEEQRYVAPGLQEVSQLSRLVIKKGKGCRLIDMEGKSYLDFMAGVAVGSLGHSHPRYVSALTEQLNKVTAGSFTTENRVALLRLIASLTPGALNRTQLYSGGAEAVEAAIRLAKSYTKGFEILSFWGGFHGKTGGCWGLLATRSRKTGVSFIPGCIWPLIPTATAVRSIWRIRDVASFAWILSAKSWRTTPREALLRSLWKQFRALPAISSHPRNFCPG